MVPFIEHSIVCNILHLIPRNMNRGMGHKSENSSGHTKSCLRKKTNKNNEWVNLESMYQGSGLPVNYIFPALLFMKYLWSVWRTQDTKNDILKIINSFLKMYLCKMFICFPAPHMWPSAIMGNGYRHNEALCRRESNCNMAWSTIHVLLSSSTVSPPERFSFSCW